MPDDRRAIDPGDPHLLVDKGALLHGREDPARRETVESKMFGLLPDDPEGLRGLLPGSKPSGDLPRRSRPEPRTLDRPLRDQEIDPPRGVGSFNSTNQFRASSSMTRRSRARGDIRDVIPSTRVREMLDRPHHTVLRRLDDVILDSGAEPR